ncbi:hypothetical protein GCM10009654_31120 [Streptomyces hebeiensis]|uniref:Transposase n=1 Tax=Streptomyces hebeiensis TaxID=229486 RepID=A0ABN1UWW3_9ACTN
MVDEVSPLIDAILRTEITIKGALIHERLTQEYGFTGNYRRVKLYLQEARPRIADELGIAPDELVGLHRPFEVIPGAQAQVDWGDEGKILAHVEIPKVYSFHMVLSYSRDTRVGPDTHGHPGSASFLAAKRTLDKPCRCRSGAFLAFGIKLRATHLTKARR